MSAGSFSRGVGKGLTGRGALARELEDSGTAPRPKARPKGALVRTLWKRPGKARLPAWVMRTAPSPWGGLSARRGRGALTGRARRWG
jgi:hypothetical protein